MNLFLIILEPLKIMEKNYNELLFAQLIFFLYFIQLGLIPLFLFWLGVEHTVGCYRKHDDNAFNWFLKLRVLFNNITVLANTIAVHFYPGKSDGCCSTHLIDGDGNFNVAGLDNFMKEVKLADCGLSYAVVSIMGPQSSGMNF